MGIRDKRIARSILYAIFFDQDDQRTSFWQRVLAFFSLFQLQLRRYHDALFKRLRTEVWELDEDEYKESFRRTTQKKALTPVGDLGYSGSVSIPYATSALRASIAGGLSSTASMVANIDNIDILHDIQQQIPNKIRPPPLRKLLLQLRTPAAILRPQRRASDLATRADNRLSLHAHSRHGLDAWARALAPHRNGEHHVW